MKKKGSSLLHDIKFQFRHGFYIAYLVASIVYVAILRLLPLEPRNFILPIILFTDPAVLGFFFISGIFFLERDQNILENLFVTPYSIKNYILNKVISLGLITYLSSVFILVLSGGYDVNWILFTITILLTATFFTLLGFILVVRTKNLNYYMMYSGLFLLIFFLPLTQYLNIFETFLYILIPTTHTIKLLLASLSQTYTSLWFPIAYLLVGCYFAYRGAVWSLQGYVISKIGGGNK